MNKATRFIELRAELARLRQQLDHTEDQRDRYNRELLLSNGELARLREENERIRDTFRTEAWKKLETQRATLLAALREIANQDFRGNEPNCRRIARAAISEVGGEK